MFPTTTLPPNPLLTKVRCNRCGGPAIAKSEWKVRPDGTVAGLVCAGCFGKPVATSFLPFPSTPDADVESRPADRLHRDHAEEYAAWARELEAAQDLGEYADPLREPPGYNAARMIEDEEADEEAGFCEHGMPYCPVCHG